MWKLRGILSNSETYYKQLILVLPNNIGPKIKLNSWANPMAAAAGELVRFAFKIAKIWSDKTSIIGSKSGIKIK